MTAPDLSEAEVAEIARKLTKAQREAIKGARESMIGCTWWLPRARHNTLSRLNDPGLSDDRSRPCQLSASGLAVRNHLIKEQGDA